MDRDQQTKDWAAKTFGIPTEDILWYNHGSCYDRIGVKTKSSADKVTQAVKGQTVNGGFYHGMGLGGQTHYDPTKGHQVTQEYYDVMC